MTEKKNILTLGQWRCLVVGGAVFVMAASTTWARDPGDRGIRGQVDGSAFAKLGENSDTLIEVNLRAPLLRILSKAVDQQDAAAGELLAQIEAISAVVVEIDKDEMDRAEDFMRDIRETLEDEGWENIARVREEHTSVNVSVLYDDDFIEGIVAMVVEDQGEKRQVVFANIAGKLDLALMGSLGGGLKIPGLENLSKVDWSKATENEGRSRRQGRSGGRE